MTSTLKIARLECFVFRAPIRTPVQTSFGIMHDRPAVLVRAEDEDGCFGWGEVWCNFPNVGAKHRARLIDRVLAPQLLGLDLQSPENANAHLFRATEVLAIQSGEYGPIAQAIAGIDQALWDLLARKRSLPLWQMLGATDDGVYVYASGLNPTEPESVAAKCHDLGFRAFKLKIGFGDEVDKTNLTRLRKTLGPDVTFMADANQAWSLEQAKIQINMLEGFNLDWLEEPLRADRPLSEWIELSKLGIPIAAGENMTTDDAFAKAISCRAFTVIQPDLAKWGGITKCLPIARAIIKAGLRYCPHYLGGGVGLLASAHCLAAAGGSGLLEIDANENPLRSLLCGSLNKIDDGMVKLGHEIGIGIAPDPALLQDFRVDYK